MRVLQRDRLRRHDAGRQNQLPASGAQRTISVRFDANVAPGLDWSFEPETRSGRGCAPARRRPSSFASTTATDRETAAVAVYNVTPEVSGAWFDKISCFCFTEQQLGPERNRRTAGRVLPRSAAREGSRHGRGRRDHAVLHALRAEQAGETGSVGGAAEASGGAARFSRPGSLAHDETKQPTGLEAGRIQEGSSMAEAHAKPHHDYHLVNPSPWPLIGSIFAFLIAVGLIMSMHEGHGVRPASRPARCSASASPACSM